MNTKHTPGPWEAADGKSGTLGGEMNRRIFIRTNFHASGKITNGPEATIATIDPNSMGNDAANIGGTPFSHRITEQEAEANAALIVAAPDMLAALKALHAILENDTTGGYLFLIQRESGMGGEDAEKALELSRAAIAKATGQQ